MKAGSKFDSMKPTKVSVGSSSTNFGGDMVGSKAKAGDKNKWAPPVDRQMNTEAGRIK